MIRYAPMLLCLSIACGEKGATPPAGAAQNKKGGPMAFPVEVEKVEARPLTYSIHAVGSLEAFENVQITARVAGVVEHVRFREGDMVKEGQSLVEIEPLRFRLEVDDKKAMLERAEAALSDAEAAAKRREEASQKNPGLIRGEELDTFRLKLRTAKAEELAAKTALEKAQLGLRDALVRAPIPGVIQTRTVQTGQYVQPGTVLATMIRRDPMLLRFKVPVKEAEPLRPGLIVDFTARGDEKPRQAKITLVTDVAEEQSRMVSVTAEVDPQNSAALRPGAFAEIHIAHGVPREAPVIAQTAIRPSEKGFLAFVVDNGVAKERVLELGIRTLDGRVEVVRGLSAGELLVVRGAEALRDGVSVRVEVPAAKGKKEAAAAGGTERKLP